MWPVSFVIGSAGAYHLPPLSFPIPPWVYLFALQAVLFALTLVAIWWLVRLEKEMTSATLEMRRLADEIRSRGAK